MACCKACCGCADCAEGDQGKCCCGGAEGDCCLEDQYCCDGVCEDAPCEDECETNEDCDYCEPGYKLVPGCSGISSALKCCDDSAVAWIDDPGDPREGNCVSDCGPGSAPSFNIVPGDAVQTGYCCDNVCQEDPCPP